MTTRNRFRFVPKENPDGTPWIAFEPVQGQLQGEGLPTGIFGFDLPPGTSSDRARQIADFLDENIAALNFTQMPLA